MIECNKGGKRRNVNPESSKVYFVKIAYYTYYLYLLSTLIIYTYYLYLLKGLVFEHLNHLNLNSIGIEFEHHGTCF